MTDKSNEDTDSQSSQGSENRGKSNKMIGQIIEEMSKCEVLYNIQHKEYRIKSTEEVKRVALKLGISEEKVKTQMSYIKMMFKKQEYRLDLLRGGVTGNSGDGVSEPVQIQSEEPTWKWYDACAKFMKKVDLSKVVTTEKYDRTKAPAAFKKKRVSQENSQGAVLVRDYPSSALTAGKSEKRPLIQCGQISPRPSTSRDIEMQKVYAEHAEPAKKRHHGEKIPDPFVISSGDSSPEADRTLTNVQHQGFDLQSSPVRSSANEFCGRISPIHPKSPKSESAKVGHHAEPSTIDEGIMDETTDMIRSYMRQYSRKEQLKAFGELSVCMHNFNKKLEK